MKLFIILAILLMTGACTSMLMGSSGKSAGSARGQEERSSAQISADEFISTAIHRKFSADDELNLLQLRVDSRRGVVTLRGMAQSFAQRDRAVRLATDIDGVIRLDNQISVNTN